MKYFNWDPAKNDRLKRERGISFEEIVFHIEKGDEVEVFLKTIIPSRAATKRYRGDG